jgi:hypothetical protein
MSSAVFAQPLLVASILACAVGGDRRHAFRLREVCKLFNQILMHHTPAGIPLVVHLRGTTIPEDHFDLSSSFTSARNMEQYIVFRRAYRPNQTLNNIDIEYSRRNGPLHAKGGTIRCAAFSPTRTIISVSYTDRNGQLAGADFSFVCKNNTLTYKIRTAYDSWQPDESEDCFYDRLRWYLSAATAATLRARTLVWFADAAWLGSQGYVPMMMHLVVNT